MPARSRARGPTAQVWRRTRDAPCASNGTWKVSPDVKPVKGRLLVEHSDCSLGELTSCNAFIFSRLADSVERVNPVSLQPTAARAWGSTSIGLALQRCPLVLSFRGCDARFIFQSLRDLPMNPANLPFDSDAMLQ